MSPSEKLSLLLSMAAEHARKGEFEAAGARS
jgi:hypothetical protein